MVEVEKVAVVVVGSKGDGLHMIFNIEIAIGPGQFLFSSHICCLTYGLSN